jgi:hypothetical protein
MQLNFGTKIEQLQDKKGATTGLFWSNFGTKME